MLSKVLSIASHYFFPFFEQGMNSRAEGQPIFCVLMSHSLPTPSKYEDWPRGVGRWPLRPISIVRPSENVILNVWDHREKSLAHY